jgi:D-alanine-D-alanine ligase
VGIVGTGSRAEVLGVLEVSLTGKADAQGYTYENKQLFEGRVTYALADDKAARAAAKLALECYRVLSCRDAGRVDIRQDDKGKPSFIEANPLAGLNPEISDLSILARLAGVSFPELIDRIVTSAAERVAPPGGTSDHACAAC